MRILVISLAGIGDVLMATPLIHELRANFPTAQIDALVRWPASKGLLEANPHLNTIHQRDLEQDGALGSLRYLWALRRPRYDVSLNTHPQGRRPYRAVARVIGARARLSHDYENAGWPDRLLVNRTLPQDYTRHCADNNLALLPLAGAKELLPAHDYELFLTPPEEAWADKFIADNNLAGRKLVGFHVGSGGTKNLALRRWPVGHYVALIQKLNQSRPDITTLLFGGPHEEQDHARITAETDRRLVFAPRTKNLREAGALLRKCGLFLSVDTVLMHVAAAVKVPKQLVIETPTFNPTVVPYHRDFLMVPNPAVAGRHLDFYRYDGRDIRGTAEELTRCMSSVTVEAVFDAIGKALP